MNFKLKNQKIAIAAIFKNEGPYIIEWLAFHRVVGVDYFFIADNDSNDGSGTLLKSLASLGFIKYLHFPSPQGQAPQLPAYRELMRIYSHLADWVAFIDADEFIVPGNNVSVKKSLSEVLQNNQNIGAVALNWATYGSAGRKEYSPDPVIERFTARGMQDFGVNRHYKSIVSVQAYETTHDNPHLFKLKADYHYVGSDGEPLRHDSNGIKGISDNVCWKNMRLNHYIVKSYDEFIFKKNRGRATVNGDAGLNRSIHFFHGHDQNEQVEDMDSDLVQKTKREIERIKRYLQDNGTSIETINIIPVKPVSVSAVVDKVEKRAGCLILTGWAFASSLQKLILSIKVGTIDLAFNEYTIIARPDVAEHVAGAPPDAGFSLSLPLEKVPDGLKNEKMYLKICVGELVHTMPVGSYNSL